MKWQGLNVFLHRHWDFFEWMLLAPFQTTSPKVADLCLCVLPSFAVEYYVVFSSSSVILTVCVHVCGVSDYICVLEKACVFGCSGELGCGYFPDTGWGHSSSSFLQSRWKKKGKRNWFYVLSLWSYFSTVFYTLGNIPVLRIFLREGDGL